MVIVPAEIPDVKIIKPTVIEDSRGYFFESYHKELFRKSGINADFIQDNQSLSQKGILRGLHFQQPPFAQGKLVRVIRGAVLDVAVDLRQQSVFYGKHIMIELSGSNKWMCWIPEGFAHGFLTLEDETVFSYKCTRYYNKEAECCLRWNDPALNIQWGISTPLLSEKDKLGVSFKNFVSPFCEGC